MVHTLCNMYLRYQPPHPFRQQLVQENNSSPSLEDLVKKMAINNIQFQQNVFAKSKELQTHIGQLANTMNQLQSKESISVIHASARVVDIADANVTRVVESEQEERLLQKEEVRLVRQPQRWLNPNHS
ncbi:hypothetical protein CR513_31660, partial [Mucuna pruriens]